jgi:hypothetical protein
MSRHLISLVAAGIVMSSSHLAFADFAYDTVDAVETLTVGSNVAIQISGIISGDSTPTTTTYILRGSSSGTDQANRCDRMALLAMSKPGKFQFVLVGPGGSTFSNCKLIVRTP